MDPTASILLALGILALMLLIRLRRARKARKVRIERMWIMPAIFLGVAGYILYLTPPPPSLAVYAVLALAVGLGAGVGWLRGRMTKITINVETHELFSQTTPWGILFLMGIIGARMGLRFLINDHNAEWHVSAAALTDGFLLFYCGMIVGRRLEILLRCLNLLREAREAKARGETTPQIVTEDHA